MSDCLLNELRTEFAPIVRNLREYGYPAADVVRLGGNVCGIAASDTLTVSSGRLSGNDESDSEFVVTLFDTELGETTRIVHAGGSSWWHLLHAIDNVHLPTRLDEFSACETGRLLVVLRAYFKPEDVHEGSVSYWRTVTDTVPDVTPREVVSKIEALGLSFEDSLSDVARNPDGSYVSDYATGERCETSAWLVGFSPLVLSVIRSSVG